jgi:hypothetical protein
MWGAAPMTEKGMYRVGRLFEKSAYFLVCSPVKKAFLSTIQQNSPARHFFTMRYDWMY